LDVPLLGAIPLSRELREASDAGTPLVVSTPDSPAARALADIARKITTSGTSRKGKPLPLSTR
ncbi:MAG: P-loop NTPase, partial [Microbacteriaceae bacterium]|nr:P-loop NTPase [Microbacteriaceae bacterium]